MLISLWRRCSEIDPQRERERPRDQIVSTVERDTQTQPPPVTPDSALRCRMCEHCSNQWMISKLQQIKGTKFSPQIGRKKFLLNNSSLQKNSLFLTIWIHCIFRTILKKIWRAGKILFSIRRLQFVSAIWWLFANLH